MIDRENIGYMYGNSVRRTVEKFLRTEMEEAKDPNIDRALMNWLTFDGDLNWYHRFFATPVNSPKFVIKLLRKVIGDVNSMTHKQVYRKYAELYKAAKETRDHKLLFEREVMLCKNLIEKRDIQACSLPWSEDYSSSRCIFST
jgi:hypothetical protein